MLTNKYETILVIDMAVGEEKITATSERFQKLIEENGSIDSVDVWGKRSLAYPINYKTEGFYVLIKFSAPPTFIAELERVYRISEPVIRSIVISLEDKAS